MIRRALPCLLHPVPVVSLCQLDRCRLRLISLFVEQKPDRYGHSLAVAEGKVPPPPKPERFADAEPTKKKGDPGENGSARDTRQRDGKGDEKAEGEVGESVKKDAASWEVREAHHGFMSRLLWMNPCAAANVVQATWTH